MYYVSDPDLIAGRNMGLKTRKRYSDEYKNIDLQGKVNVEIYYGQ